MTIEMTDANGHFFEMVPPPKATPIDARADELGLPVGLRVEKSRGEYRCACCSQIQNAVSEQIWVPDYVQRDSSIQAVSEAARKSSFNGAWSAWCLKCASRWTTKPAESVTPIISFWRRLFS